MSFRRRSIRLRGAIREHAGHRVERPEDQDSDHSRSLSRWHRDTPIPDWRSTPPYCRGLRGSRLPQLLAQVRRAGGAVGGQVAEAPVVHLVRHVAQHAGDVLVRHRPEHRVGSGRSPCSRDSAPRSRLHVDCAPRCTRSCVRRRLGDALPDVEGLSRSRAGADGVTVPARSSMRRQLRRPPGETVGLVGELGPRQRASRRSALFWGPVPKCRAGRRWADRLGRTRPRRLLRASACSCPRARDRADLAGADGRLRPDLHGPPVARRGVVRRHHGRNGREARPRARRPARVGAAPIRRRRRDGTPTEFLRRNAAAGSAVCQITMALAGQPSLLIAERADDGARRHDAGADPRPAALAASGDRMSIPAWPPGRRSGASPPIPCQRGDRDARRGLSASAGATGPERIFPVPTHPFRHRGPARVRSGLVKCSTLSRRVPMAPSVRLPTIPGVAPQPGEWPVGCHFHPRCSLAREECRVAPVALQGGRAAGAAPCAAACWRSLVKEEACR